jgi:MFS family permease
MQHRHRPFILKHLVPAALLWPSVAWSHAAEQGFVLLLPTDLYTGAGVVAVALTLAVLVALPARAALAVFGTLKLRRLRSPRLVMATSCLSAALLIALIMVGLNGPRDPLGNPLPLMVWTVFWIALVSVQGIFGNLWVYFNPLTGPLALFGRVGHARLPARWGAWPAVFGFMAFSYVLLADPAPSDPERLARIVGFYWVTSFAMALTFGPRWLVQGEVFTVLMRAYGRVAIFNVGRVGVPGWRVASARVPLAVAVLSVFLLATGSFDGLNETFWWLGLLGINPFEYPGRSGVILSSSLGIIAANVGLLFLFGFVLWLGHRLVGAQRAPLLQLYAPTLIPIALGITLRITCRVSWLTVNTPWWL